MGSWVYFAVWALAWRFRSRGGRNDALRGAGLNGRLLDLLDSMALGELTT